LLQSKQVKQNKPNHQSKEVTMEETNTGAEQVEAHIEETNTEETPAEKVETAEEVETAEQTFLSIDDLLDLTAEDFAEFEDDANHTGMKPLHHWMQHTPEEVRKHLGNLRASYTRKTQEIADLRKQLEAEREALRTQQELAVNNPVLEEMKQYNTDEEYDLYTPEGQKAEIKRQAALMVQELMKPAQEKVQLQQRQMELDRFKSNHPEITSDEFKMPMYELLKSRPELKLEDAYWLTKARIDAEKAKHVMEQQQQQKQKRRATLTKTTTGSSSTANGTPVFRDAWEAYQYHKSQGRKK